MKLTPIKNNKGIEGDKRQHIPYVLEWVCPECAVIHKIDFTRDHLSYPEFGGEPAEAYLYCGEGDCDYESTVNISLKITATLEI